MAKIPPIEVMAEEIAKQAMDEYEYKGKTIREWIDALASAELVERKRGVWIIYPGIGCKCSECDFDIGNDFDLMEYVNFCPNCGADMRGDKRDDRA